MNNSNLSHSHDDWNYMNYTNNNEAPLQEPVAFDDFQFSLGLDPNFALPIPLDMPPPPILTENELLSIEPLQAPMNHSVLDENDQKAFSQFLHQFYIDPNMQIDPHFSSIFDGPPLSIDNRDYAPPYYNHQDEEYYRQSSILQSLDEQKRNFKKEHNDDSPVFLQQSHTVSVPYKRPPNQKFIPKRELEVEGQSSSSNNSSSSGRQRTSSTAGGGAMRRNKPHKELLTEEEKRNNHIASEQKRRGMIRTGFKDLTEIVPTLKNINNSKSTVLFKSVDYIKYLEKRNKNLRDKIKHLEVRVEVEGKIHSLHKPPVADTMNAALLQHKSQQKQLLEIQEKLQQHQKQPNKEDARSFHYHQQTWPEAKMEVDSSSVNDSFIKTTVSA